MEQAVTPPADLPAKLRDAFHRARHVGNGDYNPDGDLFDVAADEIERLRAGLKIIAETRDGECDMSATVARRYLDGGTW